MRGIEINDVTLLTSSQKEREKMMNQGRKEDGDGGAREEERKR